MDVLEAPQDLVGEVLDELFLQGSRRQQAVQVCALELGDKINILQGRQENVVQRDQILVAQVLEQLEFSVCSLCKHRRQEGLHDFLHGDVLARQLVDCQAHKSKRTHAHRVEVGVAAGDFEHGAEDLCSGELSQGAHRGDNEAVSGLFWLAVVCCEIPPEGGIAKGRKGKTEEEPKRKKVVGWKC